MRHITTLQRSTPEKVGISSQSILRFLDTLQAEEIELHSLMILRHGHIVTEGWWAPYDREYRHMLFSMTKSFTALAVGFAVNEGLFSLDTAVSSIFPDVEVYQSDKYKPIQIRDLLTMSVGHQKPTMGGDFRQLPGSWVAHFLQIPITHEPGTRFMYNTGAPHILSATIQRTSGMKMADYLQPRLFEPLGITDFVWDVSPEGHSTGASGLSLRTEDIAKFGQFILQQGVWGDRQLLPASWVTAATSFQIPNGSDKNNDAQQGYGYQFWRCRHDTVRADGAFGQLCVICPQQDAVIVTTAGTARASEILDAIWTHLMPGMGDHAVHEDAALSDLLSARLGHLALCVPKLDRNPVADTQLSEKTYKMATNPYGIQELSLSCEEDSYLLNIKDAQGGHHIRCGVHDWEDGTTAMTSYLLDPNFRPTLRVKARAGWRSNDAFMVQLYFVESPFSVALIFRFDESCIQLELIVNTDNHTVRPLLTGAAI